MGFVRAIIGLMFAVLFVVFAIANRQSVEVFWSPVHPALQVPLYILTLGLLALGYFLGTLTGWAASLPLRWDRARQKRKLGNLEKKLASVQGKAKSVPETVRDLTVFSSGTPQ